MKTGIFLLSNKTTRYKAVVYRNNEVVLEGGIITTANMNEESPMTAQYASLVIESLNAPPFLEKVEPDRVAGLEQIIARQDAAIKSLEQVIENQAVTLGRFQRENNELLDERTELNARLAEQAREYENRLERRMEERKVLLEKIDKLTNFKAYVHTRLDKLEVPNNPDPEQTEKTGYRVGPRFDYVYKWLADLKADVDAAHEEISELRGEVQRLNKHITTLDGQIDSQMRTIAEYQNQSKRYSERHQLLESENRALAAENNRLRSDLDDAQSELDPSIQARQAIVDWFGDHYWDSMHEHHSIIMLHILACPLLHLEGEQMQTVKNWKAVPFTPAPPKSSGEEREMDRPNYFTKYEHNETQRSEGQESKCGPQDTLEDAFGGRTSEEIRKEWQEGITKSLNERTTYLDPVVGERYEIDDPNDGKVIAEVVKVHGDGERVAKWIETDKGYNFYVLESLKHFASKYPLLVPLENIEATRKDRPTVKAMIGNHVHNPGCEVPSRVQLDGNRSPEEWSNFVRVWTWNPEFSRKITKKILLLEKTKASD